MNHVIQLDTYLATVMNLVKAAEHRGLIKGR
jgi:hypothetical protein